MNHYHRVGSGTNRRPSNRLIIGIALLILVAAGALYGLFGRAGGFGRTASRKERSALLENSLRAIADGERRADRERWDPDYVAQELGKDPVRIYRWVRDNTYWIPYHGVLRGSIGVLMDRQGNSLDRSLLLAKLLIKSGYSVRLAHTVLNTDVVKSAMPMLAARREAHASELSGFSDNTTVNVKAAESAYDLTDNVGEDLQKRSTQFDDALSRLDSRDASQSAQLSKLIGLPDVNDWRIRFEKAGQAFADHWWVQVERGSDWRDLDLTGIHVAPDKTVATTGLDSTDFHWIRIGLVTERASEGALVTEKAFEHAIPAFSTIGQSITLTIWPNALPEESFRESKEIRDHFRNGAALQKQWVARLFIGRDIVEEFALHSTGHATNVGNAGLGGLGNAIAGIAATNDQSEMTAAWLDYEVDVPGKDPRHIRRMLFDLVGDQVREAGRIDAFKPTDAQRLERSLSLMRTIEILPVTNAIAPEYVAHLSADATLRNADILRGIVNGDAHPDPGRYQKLSDSMAPMPTQLYGVAMTRLREHGDAIDAYIDQPNILTKHAFPSVASGRIRLNDAIDIVANEVGIGLGVSNSVSSRMRQGVRDTNAEAAVPFGRNAYASVSDAFEKSKEWVVVSSLEDPEFGRLQLDASVEAKIRSDVRSGFIAVAPSKPIKLNGERFSGWWRVDPRTGSTLGFTSNGMGGDAAENAALTPIRRAFLIGRSSLVGWLFEYAMCTGAFAPPESTKGTNTEISSVEGIFELLLPAKLYATEPNGAWCAKSALVAGAIAGAAEFFVSVTWPMVVRTLTNRGYGWMFKSGRSVAEILVGGEAAEEAGEISTASMTGKTPKPCPPDGLESNADPALARTQQGEPPDPALARTQQGEPPDPALARTQQGEPPDPALARTQQGEPPDPALARTQQGEPPTQGLPQANGTAGQGSGGTRARTNGSPQFDESDELPFTEDDIAYMKASANEPREQNYNYQQAVKRYRQAVENSQKWSEQPESDLTTLGREQAANEEAAAERALQRAHNQADNAPIRAAEIEKANNEYIDAWNQRAAANREFEKYIENGGEFSGPEYERWKKINEMFQQARRNLGIAYKGMIPTRYPAARGTGQSAPEGNNPGSDVPQQKTLPMPNAQTIPAGNGKTVPMGDSKTIACQNVPAPVATAAGMSGAAKAIGNK